MNKKSFILRMAFGVALTLTGLILSVVGHNAVFLAIVGLAGIAIALALRWRDGDQPEGDERSGKIWAYGAAYAWLIGLYFITVLMLGVYFSMISISTVNALVMVAGVMVASAIILMRYFRHKGDGDW